MSTGQKQMRGKVIINNEVITIKPVLSNSNMSAYFYFNSIFCVTQYTPSVISTCDKYKIY